MSFFQNFMIILILILAIAILFNKINLLSDNMNSKISKKALILKIIALSSFILLVCIDLLIIFFTNELAINHLHQLDKVINLLILFSLLIYVCIKEEKIDTNQL